MDKANRQRGESTEIHQEMEVSLWSNLSFLYVGIF